MRSRRALHAIGICSNGLVTEMISLGQYPLVSIGMSVRNCQATLPLAVASIVAQTYANWELLLIDDGSMDQTLEVARRFVDPRIKIYADGESRGLPYRLNQALELSRGQLFARMDGDDMAYPQRLERQVAYLKAHPAVDVIGSSIMYFQRDGMARGKRLAPETHRAICSRPADGFPMAHPTYVGHLAWFRRFQYDETAIRCEDQDLLLRAHSASTFGNIPEILLGYRQEKLGLRKTLRGRRSYVRSAIRELGPRGRLWQSLRIVIAQGSRAAVEVVFVTIGMEEQLLQRRAQALTTEEKVAWVEARTRVKQCIQ